MAAAVRIAEALMRALPRCRFMTRLCGPAMSLASGAGVQGRLVNGFQQVGSETMSCTTLASTGVFRATVSQLDVPFTSSAHADPSQHK